MHHIRSGDALPEKQPYKHHTRRNRNHLEEYDEEEKHPYAHSRIEHQVRPQNSGDGARRAHCRQRRSRLGDDVRGGGRDTANEIEDEKTEMPETVLDVVAEYPEKESVAEDVTPAAVQEHRDQRRPDVDRVVVHDA